MLFVGSVSQRLGNALYVWLLCSLLFTPSCSLALDNNPEPTWPSADGAAARGACVDDTHYPHCSKTDGNALQGHKTRACHPAGSVRYGEFFPWLGTKTLKERNNTREKKLSRVKLSGLSLSTWRFSCVRNTYLSLLDVAMGKFLNRHILRLFHFPAHNVALASPNIAWEFICMSDNRAYWPAPRPLALLQTHQHQLAHTQARE